MSELPESDSPGVAEGGGAEGAVAEGAVPSPAVSESSASENQSRQERPLASGSAPDSANLNLVMDVELNVTLRFGQRSLTLREVLDLSSGSVIELDRQVDDPVELLLDGKVIARGEAVVIDGNYGLRVTEIPRPYIQSGGGDRASR